MYFYKPVEDKRSFTEIIAKMLETRYSVMPTFYSIQDGYMVTIKKVDQSYLEGMREHTAKYLNAVAERFNIPIKDFSGMFTEAKLDMDNSAVHNAVLSLVKKNAEALNHEDEALTPYIKWACDLAKK